MIDKAMGGDVNDLAALKDLLTEMVDAGYVAFDLGVGPTDYMTASNKDEVMEHPMFHEIAQMFHQVTFNAAFLETNMEKYTQMCAEIDHSVPGKPIRFLIPAAPYFFRNEKFGNMVGKKLSDIQNIPYGRAKQKTLMVSEQLKRMSYRITQYYSELEGQDERRRNPDLHYDTGTMCNLLYTDGKLYWVPFLKDDCPFLDDEFTIPKPWTMENLLTVRQKALDASLEYLKDTPCLTCPYVSSCSEKGITTIMHHMSIRDCLVGLQYVQ